MIQGNWVGEPLPVSSFLFSSVFRSALQPLWAHQLPGMGLGVSPYVPRSFSFSSLFFCSLLFFVLLLLLYEHINCPGWGWVSHLLCLDPFPFSLLTCLSFFSLSLTLMRTDPAVAGFRSLYNTHTNTHTHTHTHTQRQRKIKNRILYRIWEARTFFWMNRLIKDNKRVIKKHYKYLWNGCKANV